MTYISHAVTGLPTEQITTIGTISQTRNQCENITGVLLYIKGIFFQILEGDEETVDSLYSKILSDPRHTDVVCLKAEYGITERLFPQWTMKIINLDQHTDVLLQPIKVLLQTVAESHQILGKYTQPALSKIVEQGTNPLTLSPHIVEKIIFFSDIVSFSTFAEKLPVNQVVTLVNDYLRVCSSIIADHGGEVVKFIGDCIMASFSSDKADSAIQACLAILKTLQDMRDNTKSDEPAHLLYTGIGLAWGKVIEGNIGSSIKMDYTLLGDSVNIAARLESLTRQLPYYLVLSEEIKNLCQHPWLFTHLGEQQVKGKQSLITIYTINEDIVKKPLKGEGLAKFIEKSLSK